MRTAGNIFWILFGGLEMAFGWFFAGCLWCITIVGIPIGQVIAGTLLCITIIGIPFGLQHFQFARLALTPFSIRVIQRYW